MKTHTLKWLFLFLVSLIMQEASAQLEDPVAFTVTQKRISPTELRITFDGTIASGWHVYSTDLQGGPTPATIHFSKLQGLKPQGSLKAGEGEKSAMDPVFGMKVRFFENHAVFTQTLQITQPHFEVEGYLEYGACNDRSCAPPTAVDFSFKGQNGPAANSEKEATTDIALPTQNEAGAGADTARLEHSAADSVLSAFPAIGYTPDDSLRWWQPSVSQLRAFGGETGQEHGLLVVFLLGMLGGLLALLTPCVWPIIPMTVSFFLHRNNNKRRALREAMLYGLSIVVIYVGLGLLVTLLSGRGASALNDLSTNAIFNVFLFLLLVVFAASFLGGFEITLPSKWNNRVNDSADRTTGLVSIFLMALTLVLVSFSCTGPIIGFLLVEISTRGNMLYPTAGMFGFALALSIPFSLFALFPTWLKKLPKSGGWMNVVKVTLGFIELAFALKFLSVADLAYGWHLLDRETFLSLWIVIFFLLGLYLLGKLKFPGDDANNTTSVPRFFLALISLSFAVYMVPGLWGAPLKAISAFSPPIYTQDFNLNHNEVIAKFHNYEEGMAYASKAHKPVLLDFTGYGCVNCRKMEMAVWNDRQVKNRLENDYVLISLYVDDKTPLPQKREIIENGSRRVLRTVGDLWSYLQRHKFGTNAQPFYVPVDNTGQPLNHSFAYKEDVAGYLKFLDEGLDRYRKTP